MVWQDEGNDIMDLNIPDIDEILQLTYANNINDSPQNATTRIDDPVEIVTTPPIQNQQSVIVSSILRSLLFYSLSLLTQPRQDTTLMQQYDLSNSEHEMKMSREQEQYMVLYNGNAEVVGNFRALNFYKASDINIKENIRLIGEGKSNSCATPPLTIVLRS
jgi:hypothetical protein